ncbi:oxygen-independent coproporphyrinogen III oxidase [Bacteroides sp.]|uniref:oxygen-independent coproporphyrinogen III oxidase n=1 Tax=Bacteroides sp. TaxID=29523 RepID=UPI002FC9E691
MHTELINKYNVPVPRYTSYPPANYFEPFSNSRYLEAVEQSNHASDSALSFYLHIPFCRHLCHYCGCNSYPMARTEIVESYVKALHQEMELILPLLDKNRPIAQIHYGGGSPTAIPIALIKELNDHLLSSFPVIDRPEIAIECHPGYLSEADWQQLTGCGFNRFSIGVQDFNTEVLKIVNRRPSLLPMEVIFALLREKGASINLDLLYGLPKQTVDSFARSIEQAIALSPDRLVTFGYAHVPWVNKRQLILEKSGLPDSREKRAMFDTAAGLLHASGYQSIGMDHFVRPNDELSLAMKNRQLHRNFQGYCTRRTTAQVYALGVTGISQLESAYAQNTKDIPHYIETMGRGELCIAKGYALSPTEQLTREVIEALMCNECIDWKALSERLHVSVSALKAATAYDEQKLSAFAHDGLIRYTDTYLEMTAEGSAFVRNVAASLDKLMLHTPHSYSKPL